MARRKHKQNFPMRKAKKRRNPLIGKSFSGTLDVTRHGKGYVTVAGRDEDILIYPENLELGFKGDTVEIVILKVSKSGRPEGRVVRVLNHARTEFVGRLEVNTGFAFLIPDEETVPIDIFIPSREIHGAKDGDHVLVSITNWQGKTKNPVGSVVEILSGERENAIAMTQILTENGFSPKFPDAVIEAAKKLSDGLIAAELKRRKDLRDVLTFTIDPDDAKDFDDALSVRTLDNGDLEVGVHIADVSFFVQTESELDKEAYRRATSVYFPGIVYPMLPERISNNLCSLRPNEDKLVFSVLFRLNSRGTVHHFDIGRNIIRSNKRMTYNEAQKIIETSKGDYADDIKKLNQIAQKLRQKRFSKGAINFSSEEVRFKLDENGKPIGLEIKKSHEAHQLIEEFMLLANKTVATFVADQKLAKSGEPIPFPYRVHDTPNEEKLATFAAFASRLGYQLNLANPTKLASSFNKLLEDSEGKPEKAVLEQLGIRTMAKATYSTENIGHYGLGFKNYCHFTSPIRRYPDIMVHRILQEILDGKNPSDKAIETKCNHCSTQERNALDAERAANKYKQVEYMEQFLGETLDAVITGVSANGFWAETVEQKCEGMVSCNSLLDKDTFEYQESTYSLVGWRSGLRFQMGDKVKIRVVDTNLGKRQIDFEWAPTRKKSSRRKL